MKAILILLGVFLALTVRADEEQRSVAEKEESNVPAAAALNRDVRGADERCNKLPGMRWSDKKQRCVRKGRGRSRKNGKKCDKGKYFDEKKNKCVKKSRNPSKKRKSNKKCPNGRRWNGRECVLKESRSLDRQATTAAATGTSTCFADLIKKLQKFNAAQTNYRMVTRIKNWNTLLKNKKDTSKDAFKDSLEAMEESTGGGKECGGGAMDKESKEVFDKLKDCAKTASANCDTSNMTKPVDDALLTKCEPLLKAFTTGFKDCLTKSTEAEQCSCVQGLTDPEKDCLAWKDVNLAMKEQKQKCTKGDKAGSFGDCRKQERLAAKFGNKCKVACKKPGMTTTKAPPSGRFNALNNLKQNKWKNN